EEVVKSRATSSERTSGRGEPRGRGGGRGRDSGWPQGRVMGQGQAKGQVALLIVGRCCDKLSCMLRGGLQGMALGQAGEGTHGTMTGSQARDGGSGEGEGLRGGFQRAWEGVTRLSPLLEVFLKSQGDWDRGLEEEGRKAMEQITGLLDLFDALGQGDNALDDALEHGDDATGWRLGYSYSRVWSAVRGLCRQGTAERALSSRRLADLL
ncbi:unnamed protein product, partial [Discosporangium mesarthrocarpum]